MREQQLDVTNRKMSSGPNPNASNSPAAESISTVFLEPGDVNRSNDQTINPPQLRLSSQGGGSGQAVKPSNGQTVNQIHRHADCLLRDSLSCGRSGQAVKPSNSQTVNHSQSTVGLLRTPAKRSNGQTVKRSNRQTVKRSITLSQQFGCF